MPRISVVVPIYNVERYLADCLDSIARQTVADLEVVMVDDGSTDRSAQIAEDFAGRDPRFRLISKSNGGLGSARNAGADVTNGEFLAFVDSDDVLARNAYELLLGALAETGSDFATGNVHRLTPAGARQSPFLARAFGETRLKTHVTRFRGLLADRIAPNKLWRRSFWDEHELRFPEGVVHEDIPVVVPAHFMASSVDVIADPIYYYRIRGGEELSITQRRLEPRVLLDRLAAIEHVRAYLAREGSRKARRWYDESVVADDLRYFVDVLPSADEQYRALFLDRVNALLDRASDRIFDPLAAIERLRWHLVRRRLMAQLLEVLRFEREDLRETPPVRAGRHWYGDYPFRTDRELAIPRSVYRVDSELALSAVVDSLRWEDGRLRIGGWAFIRGIGAAAQGSQRVALSVLRPGPLRRVRLRTVAVRLRTAPAHRPDATARSGQSLCDVSWAGFDATLDPRALTRPLGRWRSGTWDLYVAVGAGGQRRRGLPRWIDDVRPLTAVELPVGERVRVTAGAGSRRRIAVRVRTRWAAACEHRALDGKLELSGRIEGLGGGGLKLRARTEDGPGKREYPIAVAGGTFTAQLPPADLRAAVPWMLEVVAGGRVHAVAMSRDDQRRACPCDGFEAELAPSPEGNALLTMRTPPRPVATEARWTDDDDLRIAGELPLAVSAQEIVVSALDRAEQHAFPTSCDVQAGRFEARLAPTRIASLAGPLPLRTGRWALLARIDGATTVPLMLDPALDRRLPLTTRVASKPFTLSATADSEAVLMVGHDLGDDERGGFHQRRLQRTTYAASRGEPLRDAVVYASFGGRQYSDSPRALHEELVRRGAPLEHLWVVRDGMCRVPDGATVLREGGREHFAALARSRYVVTNDHFPGWFRRRPDQVCVQTWHGTPLKRLGLDVSRAWGTIRRFERRWREQSANWQYVVSPNRFTTPILRRAFEIQGEMLETGYPRDDVLARPHRDARERLRRRLDLPDSVRTVLYAPTYRDHVVDSRGRHRLDLQLDVKALRAALGKDAVILFRKHHYVVDAVPATADGFVRDVSSYPDGTELLLAADVLVTDYSSMMFDFANTGRPMLFFTYDLEAYQNEIRGFYFDFVATAPGPLLRTNAELTDALRALDAVQADYADRYAAFRSTYCELDDGGASARVVDRIFGS